MYSNVNKDTHVYTGEHFDEVAGDKRDQLCSSVNEPGQYKGMWTVSAAWKMFFEDQNI